MMKRTILNKSIQHMQIIGKKNDWETDKDFYAKSCKKYKINPKIDVCADSNNTLCQDFFDRNKNGLDQDFKKSFFMNPPYDPDYLCMSCNLINSFVSITFTLPPDSNKKAKKTRETKCDNCGAGMKMRKVLHRGVSEWLEKGYIQHLKHNVDGMILTFAKTDTKWWHEFVEDKAEVHFIKGRLRFNSGGIRSAYPAPYGSCFIIYRKKK